MGHFDGHTDALKRYRAHHLMQHVQGCSGSRWMPSSGNYLLRIAPAAARVKISKTTMKHVPTLLAVSVAIAMRRYDTKRITQWRRFMAFIKAPKRRHRANTCSNSINWTRQRWLILTFHREKGLKLTCWPLITGYDIPN